MSKYFEVKASYEMMLQSGAIKRVTERYLVDALSCMEAEVRATEELTPIISGDFLVTSAKTTPIAEVVNLDAERYYLAKVGFITIDERSGTEKKSISQILVGASDFCGAYDTLLESMKDTMTDWELVSLAESSIVDVYPVKL